MSEVKTALAQKAASKPNECKEPRSIKGWITVMEPEIKKALPSVITPERFTRMALTAVSTNPKLAECSPKSFMGALMTAAQLGLEPNTPLGQAYLIPYKNKGAMEAQFQFGYRGMIDLANRSGEIRSIEAHIVYENDEFDFAYGLENKLLHKPAKTDKGEPVWVYAVFKLVNGGYGFEVMSIDDVRAHAKKYSQSYNSSYSPWTTSFEEMAKKTVLKRVLKYAPLKADFVRGLASDESIKVELGEDMTEIPSENVFEGDFVEVDAETGEVVENA
jgi:recombination protein RecT